jgi:peptidoglycan/LPS O-acetylase OafA/YrhL
VTAFDGLRTISIAMVVGCHVAKEVGTGRLGYILSLGWYGVDIFFVLSGFLITRNLVAEYQSNKRIHLMRFYFRRLMRLQPAYLTAIGVTVLGYSSVNRAHFAEMAHRLPFLVTYSLNMAISFGRFDAVGGLGQAWSLCIEEQFYLFWPNVIQRLGPLRALRFLLVTIVALTIYRVLLFANGAGFQRIYYATDTRIDTILIGCAAALLFQFHKIDSLIEKRWFGKSSLAIAIGVFALCIPSWRWTATVGFGLMATAVASVIVNLVRDPDAPLARLLSYKPLVRTGRISYGIYLFHTSVLFVGTRLLNVSHVENHGLRLAMLLAFVWCGSICVAQVHYSLLERRVMDWRDRWELRSCDSPSQSVSATVARA